jgi:hypothetical protein
LPISNSQLKTEENLLLDKLEPVLQQIADFQAQLQDLLDFPFIQNSKEEVNKLNATFDKTAQILDAWFRFQSNWILISALFVFNRIE